MLCGSWLISCLACLQRLFETMGARSSNIRPPFCKARSSYKRGEGTVDRDIVASNCSTGNRLFDLNMIIKLEKLELRNLSSMRVSNRIIPPSKVSCRSAKNIACAPLLESSSALIKNTHIVAWGSQGRGLEHRST